MKLSNSYGWRRTALGIGLLLTALLASCGGGEQVSTFRATRVLAFGDESSVINNDHSKYTVNAVASGSTTALDCSSNPLWIQSLAAIYGLQFPQCPSDLSGVEPSSRIYAANGALVADLAAQIDQHLTSGGGFADRDLVTVLVGANDVIAQFAQYPAVGEDQLQANVDAAGAQLAAQVNRLAEAGARVIISTIPDMGRTPFAGDRSVGSTNGDPAVLSRLSTHFNDALLANLTNDGHKIGLVQLDQYVIAIDNQTQSGITGGYANTTLASCIASIPVIKCTSNTLVPDAANARWLWADDRHLSATGQAALGSLAATRAQNNPF